MSEKYFPKYPLNWKKDDFAIKIFCSIPNLATGILLRAEKDLIVVDPGDGILRDLNTEIGSEGIMKIQNIFITHGHHDHVGGVWSLLTYLSVMRKKNDLNIYYPKGCVEIESIYNAFKEVYGKELTYKINLKTIDIPEDISIDLLKIKPFKVNHKEPTRNGKSVNVPSLGFKFFFDNKTICYGGDTAYCETLIDMVKDSDLAIIEAGAEDDKENDMHLTIEEARKIGETAKEYFLVHVPE